ncbi:HlyD family efflux transporter periplasmic adaptor subunit [Roseomonas sp. CCTCC AB2023176]|uniref:HlyD family efflux transporter periplasmic adaptor subunit n=1 Tax=Roseomonas sp. CCTCC AB2023176 TaxID=3342640 RepID=UPI0035D9F925
MKRWAFLLGLGAFGSMGGYAWHAGLGPFEPPAVVTPAQAAPAQPLGIGALGRVEPASRILKLTQGGMMGTIRLDRLLVREGETVRAGQVLAEFSDAAQKDAAVGEAEAKVAQMRATLDKVRAGGSRSEVEAARARIASARAAEEIARRDTARSERLLPSGAETAATYDRNRFLAAQRAAERAQAEADLETLTNPRREDVARAAADLAAAEASLAKARADAVLSRLYAPIDGTILRVIARAGEPVSNDGVLEMGDLTRLDVVADVYETDMPRMREGATAEVVVPGQATRYPGRVREIGWVVRRTTQAGTDPVAAVDARTVEVRIELGEEGRQALMRRSNMQVQVAIRP